MYTKISSRQSVLEAEATSSVKNKTNQNYAHFCLSKSVSRSSRARNRDHVAFPDADNSREKNGDDGYFAPGHKKCQSKTREKSESPHR